MGNLNYIVFGGVDSRDYGIYISGEGVFNAPERDVEVVNIPGKDGDLLIDRGRFLNIQVIYPGFNFEPDLSTFAERLRAFRAALASQVGYQRLEDSFHPDEFRLASFRSGLDVKPVMYNTASTFDIVFDCKPQRFLKSGEEEITIGEWGETETITGDIATFEAEANTGIKSLVVDIDPVQSGSGDPSPTNVRPISGYDGVTVYNTGVNVWDEEWELGGISDATGLPYDSSGSIRCKNYIPILPNTSYYYKSSANVQKTFYDADKGYIGKAYGYNSVFTTPSNAYFMKIAFVSAYGTTYKNDTSINYPSTDHEYHSCQGESHSIPFKDSQGNPITVYGGNINITDGEGSNGMGIVDLGTLTWAKGTTRFTTASLASLIKKPTSNGDVVLCRSTKKMIAKSLASVSGNAGTYEYYVDNEGRIAWYYPLDGFADGNAFKTAMSGVYLIYELATPTPIYCEPTEINTLDGVNNIWADSGEVSVEIGEDPNILVNPTPFEALPIFEVVGTGSLTVGNTTINITGDSTQDIFIDSDIMEAYEDDNGAIISRNDRINLSGTDFPKLGEKTRVEANGLTSVKITPKWWTI